MLNLFNKFNQNPRAKIIIESIVGLFFFVDGIRRLFNLWERTIDTRVTLMYVGASLELIGGCMLLLGVMYCLVKQNKSR